MKLILLTFETKKDLTQNQFNDQYATKIKRFIDFEIINIKSPSLERDDHTYKIETEAQLLLKQIKADDLVILLDEKGKTFDSQMFSKALIKCLESGKKRIVFVVGGAFGVAPTIKKRANSVWKLSDLTLNHRVAQTVLLEQIYRGFTIWKGIPYHNE